MPKYVEIGTVRAADLMPVDGAGSTLTPIRSDKALADCLRNEAVAVTDAWDIYNESGDAAARAALEDRLADVISAVANLAAAEGLELTDAIVRCRHRNAELGCVTSTDGIDADHTPWHVPLGHVWDNKFGINYELMFDMSGRQEFWVRSVDDDGIQSAIHWSRIKEWMDDGYIACNDEQRETIFGVIRELQSRSEERRALAEAAAEQERLNSLMID